MLVMLVVVNVNKEMIMSKKQTCIERHFIVSFLKFPKVFQCTYSQRNKCTSTIYWESFNHKSRLMF